MGLKPRSSVMGLQRSNVMGLQRSSIMGLQRVCSVSSAMGLQRELRNGLAVCVA